MDIISAATKYKMFQPGDKVLVAVSGGPDSVAMLHVLHTQSREYGITLHIAHLNHGIRGEQSNLDEKFVRNLAHTFGLEITVERMDVPSLRVEMKMGVEEAARIIRYKFLLDTYTHIGASKIAVGHNADDRAESVLLNVIRGTGIDGLGSIRPIRGNIVRPLIDTPRSDIEAYIRENALPYRVDESNMDINYTRNRIRHELIPLLESNYNPQVKDALVRLAQIAADQSNFIADLTVESINRISEQGIINPQLFLELHSALQYQIIRSEIQRLKGDLRDVAFEQVERVIDALSSGEDFTITLPSGRIYAQRKDKLFQIRGAVEQVQVEPFDYVLKIPGRTVIDQIALAIDTEIIEGAIIHKAAANEVLIGANAITGTLRMRNIHPGDRITPFGMHGTKKLQDIFVDKKIPKPDRARAAVVVDDEKILWVVGIISSEAGRVTDKTRQTIRMTAGL